MKNYLISNGIISSDIRKDTHASRFLIANDKNDYSHDWISFKHISQKNNTIAYILTVYVKTIS